MSNNCQTVGCEFTRVFTERLFHLNQLVLDIDHFFHLRVESIVFCIDIVFGLLQLLISAKSVLAACWNWVNLALTNQIVLCLVNSI